MKISARAWLGILVVLGALAVVAWPLVLIWGLNVLFALALPYTFKTWCAALVLSALFSIRGKK